jgi:AmpD protein
MNNSHVNKAQSALVIENGWLADAEKHKSPHFSVRCPDDGEISLAVIHNISLPPGQFGGNEITDFFLGKLDCSTHPFFAEIAGVRVSAHCLIRRDGHIIQYVSFLDKAWHAGVSTFKGRDKCNDFAIGIELEGTDTLAYNEVQYQQLALLVYSLQQKFKHITTDRIVGHCDIAPGRKTDPGVAFDWQYFNLCLQHVAKNPL